MITSLQNPLVKHLVKLRQDKEYRYQKQSVLVEGIKPVTERCQMGKVTRLIAKNHDVLPKEGNIEECVIVTDAVMQKISGMVQSDGLLAEVPMPQSQPLSQCHRVLIVDSISDPGNVGTLMRTALALGWDGVYFVGNYCDLFNEKALRASRGASFTLPFCQGSWMELKEWIHTGSCLPLLADLKGSPPESFALTPHSKILLVLSNEAHGPSEEAKKLCQLVSIPMSCHIESLNVSAAGAILMYLLGPKSNE